MKGLLGVPLGSEGSGRTRYARAMTLYREGRLSEAQLEAYRTAAGSDSEHPRHEFQRRGLDLPPDPPPTPEAAIRTLVDESDRYLASLAGPGVAEVRTGIAAWRDGPVHVSARANPVVRAHLARALRALDADHPELADSIARAAPFLDWVTYDGYAPGTVGAGFQQAHAFASVIGNASALPAEDFDLGFFLIAPHVLYRDHRHPAPELYAPLTGPHGWRFGPDRPLTVKPAHVPIWNPSMQTHLTKVGPLPFLCLYAWVRDVDMPAEIVPATDWESLEALRLG
ncbi:MAG: hypothetical protein KDK12_03125 [Rhodobacteraceae bacterium]|nr:hypothetical protein [Paracoccaceae bacterium]